MGLDLTILIEGDPKGFVEAMDEIKKESEDLNKILTSVGTKAGIAFAALGGAIVGSLVAFRDSEKTIAQLDATLKSTGFAAGLTSKEIQNMAGQFQGLSNFGDEAIITGQSVLLKFRSIGKDGFEPATAAMLDMATAMQTDTSSAAQLLGKALENPQQGITLLAKQGVTFTEEQKKLIKVFDETGRSAEAQAIILERVGVAFGGSAAAATGGLGVFVQLKEVIGDIVEGIGAEFAPTVASIGQVLLGFARAIKENETLLKALARLLAAGAGMAGFITAVTFGTLAVSKIVTALSIFQTAMGVSRLATAAFIGTATLGIGLIIAFLPEIIAFAKNMITAFTQAKDAILTLFSNLASNLGNIISKLGDLLADIFTFDFSGAADSAAALKDAVQGAIEQTFKDGVEVQSSFSVGFDKNDKLAEDAKTAKETAEKAAFDAGQEARAKELDAEKEHNAALAAENARSAALQLEQEKLKQEIIAAQRAGARDEVIKLKEQELSLLKSLEDAKTAADRELAQLRLDQFRRAEGAKLAEISRGAGLEIQANKVKAEILAAEKRGESAEFIKIKEQELQLIKALQDATTKQDIDRAAVQLANFKAAEASKIAEVQRSTDLQAQQEELKRAILTATRNGESADFIKIKEEELNLLRALEGAKGEADRELAALRLQKHKEESDGKIAEAIRVKAIEAQIETEKGEIIREERKGTSDEIIRIKSEEMSLLKALEDAKTAQDRELAQIRLDEFRAHEDERIAVVLEKQQQETDEKRIKKLEERENDLALQEEFAALDEENRAIAQETNLQKLSDEQLMRREVLRANAQEEVNTKQKARDQQLKDEQKFGTSYAAIQAALNSSQVQGVRNATGQLVELQNSRNSTLKGIGKAAAVTQIGIDTAKSAMSIYAGFSTIPIIGPALGIAGAAAAIAFGFEKINQVRSAQEGGIVPGGGSGDIIPAFLEPGEIVVPKALTPTFREEFGLSEDPASSSRRGVEIKVGTVIGTEEYVRSNIIPVLRDAVQLDNANIGVG